jgi:parallel beta-helix repeat protein
MTIISALNPKDHVIEITADWVNVSGFTVSDASGSRQAGFFLNSSSNNKISGNIVSNNLNGIDLKASNNNTISNNTIKTDWFMNDGILIESSKNNLIFRNTIISYSVGIDLFSSRNNTITSNTLLSNDEGIFLVSSKNNTITSNTASLNGWGITLQSSSDFNILGNNSVLSSWYDGIVLKSSSNNILSGNTVSSSCCALGITLRGSNYNTISSNTVSDNWEGGFALASSVGNIIYYNNIIDNTIQDPIQAYDENPSENDWHHPTLLEGNYWSDYNGEDDGSGTGKHAIAGDDIGDTLIPHPSAGYDFYPFINPIVLPVEICDNRLDDDGDGLVDGEDPDCLTDYIPIIIDIKPGSDENSINTKKKGVIPVAIKTTYDFSALEVDWTTVRFGNVAPVHGINDANAIHDLTYPDVHNDHTTDIDEDGDRDLILHFNTQETGLKPGDTEAWLTGETYIVERTVSGLEPSPRIGNIAVKFAGNDTVRILK